MQPVVTLGCVESKIVHFVVEIGGSARGLNADLYPRHGFTNGLAKGMELDPFRRRLVTNAKKGSCITAAHGGKMHDPLEVLIPLLTLRQLRLHRMTHRHWLDQAPRRKLVRCLPRR